MSIKSDVFDDYYYSHVCLGSDEFKKSKGLSLNPKVKQMLDKLYLTSSMNVLEIGCGRGDSAIYLAKKVNSVTAIDYSKAAIKIANKIKSISDKNQAEKINFYVMEASKLRFDSNKFDMVIMIDTIDHFNKKELDKVMSEIRRVLKPGGKLFVKTCTNKILLDKTYKYYIYPINKLITDIDMRIKNTKYDSLPRLSRTKEAKEQHVNEMDYFYLKNIMSKFGFSGKVWSEVGFLTEDKGLRSKIYNFMVTFDPLSRHFPLNIFFAHSFFVLAAKSKSV